MDSTRINAREIVMDMLLEVVRNQTHSHILIKNVLDKYNYIEEQEKAFIKRALNQEMFWLKQLQFLNMVVKSELVLI